MNDNIIEIYENKKDYLELLLLADEQEDMIDCYLSQGRLFVLSENPKVVNGHHAKCIAVVIALNEHECELKNIATAPQAQGQGYGRKMIDFLFDKFLGTYQTIYVGTGDVPSTIGFYQHCGFRYSHRVKDFFTDNYREPIIEDGIQLRDMVYLRKDK